MEKKRKNRGIQKELKRKERIEEYRKKMLTETDQR